MSPFTFSNGKNIEYCIKTTKYIKPGTYYFLPGGDGIEIYENQENDETMARVTAPTHGTLNGLTPLFSVDANGGTLIPEGFSYTPGAEFLINSSNDGWFRETSVVRQHFFNARLRAIETRKDIAVNSNNGISGLVLASGDVAVEMSGCNSYVEVVTITPNKVVTWYTLHPYLPLLFCGIYLFGFMSFRFIRSIWIQTLTRFEPCQS